MYLVFDLPQPGGTSFPTAHAVAFWLHRELERWHERYEIPYKTKFHKNRLRLIMDNEADYHFFMLSWNPDFTLNGLYKIDPSWSKVRVVNPPKH
jgi:hypothetical protein